MSQTFPLNYFSTIFSPIKSFLNRRYLKIWQMILIFLVLTALMMMPVAVSIGQIQQINLNDFVPDAVSTVDDTFVDTFLSFEIDADGKPIIPEETLTLDTEENVSGFVDTQADASALLENRVGIILSNEGFIIQETESPALSQEYIADSNFDQVTNKESFMTELSRQWFNGNRMAILFSNLINVWFLMLLSFIFLVGGSSLFLSLMRFSSSFDIKSYREAFTICLNSIGVPTLIAVVIGLFTSDPIMMLTAQGLLFVLMLLWVYWKTHYNDAYVASLDDEEDEDEEDYIE